MVVEAIEMVRIEKIDFKTGGMHCINCENRIKETVLSIEGVKDIKVDYFTEKTTIEFDPTKTDFNNIMKTIRNIGYYPREISQKKNEIHSQKVVSINKN